MTSPNDSLGDIAAKLARARTVGAKLLLQQGDGYQPPPEEQSGQAAAAIKAVLDPNTE